MVGKVNPPEKRRDLMQKAQKKARSYQRRRSLLKLRIEKMLIEVEKMKVRTDAGEAAVKNALLGIARGRPDLNEINRSETLVEQYIRDLKHIETQKGKILRTVDRINEIAGSIEKLRIEKPNLDFFEREVSGKKERLKRYLEAIKRFKSKGA